MKELFIKLNFTTTNALFKNRKIKNYKLFLLFGLFLNLNYGFSQTFNYRSEILNQIKFPKSPEANAFEKYGNNPVNLYTGQPNIDIPLHTLMGREFSVPISLTYDASGIKVDQIATSAGLGWNLNVGGRISRLANGRPDDVSYTTGAYENLQDFDILNNMDFSSNNSFVEYQELVKSLKNGCKDLLIDIYSLNAMGINDYIVIDIETKQAHTLINPNIKVVGGISPTEWIVTDTDGTKYYFGQNNTKETSETAGIDDGGGVASPSSPCPSPNIVSTTSWLLTKIISKNGLDIFTFEYNFYSWANSLYGQSVTSASNNLEFSGANTYWSGTSINYSFTGSYKTSQRMIKTIKLNNTILVNFNYKARNDIQIVSTTVNNDNSLGNALDNIVLYKFKPYLDEGQLTVFKKILFNHSYFGSSTPSTTLQRLKLDNIIISGDSPPTNDNSKKYSFVYFRPSSVPSITSNAQDFLGLYNSQISNQNLIPRFISQSLPLSGANRSFDLESSLNGTLEKIIYPTRGYTKFLFEQHNSKPANSFGTNEKVIYGEGGIGQFLDYNIRSQYIHPYLIEAGATSIKTSLMTIPESGTYHIKGQGNGLFLIHRPICTNDEQIPVYNRNNNLNNKALAIMPTCRNPTLFEGNLIWSQFSLPYPPYTMNGTVLYGTYASNRTVYLQAGTYQFTTWGKENNLTGPGGGSLVAPTPTYVEVFRNITVYPENENVQGFRIKSISDYTSDAVLASQKDYKYTEEINNTISSGILLSDIPTPTFYTTKANGFSIEHIVRSSGRIENNPHVVYKNVFEILKNGSGNGGYTEHKFHCNNFSSGLVSTNGIKAYINPNSDGKEYATITFDATKKRISETFFKYKTTSFPATFGGASATTDYSYIDKVMVWYHYPGDDYYYSNHSETISPPFGVDVIPGMAFPLCYPNFQPCYGNFNDFHYNGLIGDYSNYRLGTNFESGYTNLIEKTYRLYTNKLITGSTSLYESIDEVETYKFDDGYNLIREKGKSTLGMLNVNGGIVNGLKTKYTYDDTYFPGNPEKITDEEIYNVTSGSEQLISKRHNVYTDYGNSNGNIVNYLSEIKTAKSNNPLKTRLLLNYDLITKNITNTTSPSNSNPANENYDSYIFGYNDMYPVAKLAGVKYNQISAARINAIKAKANTVVNLANNNLLIAELNLLRLDFPLAQITTYTYDPVFGVTSVTDPKGDIKYFNYDELGRLLNIKDKEGNTLSQNEYHYKN